MLATSCISKIDDSSALAPMHLFVDTNILLSFYHLTDEDIGELQKLPPLIDHKKLTLWTTAQLCDEYLRNRGSKIRDALKDFHGPKWSNKAPAFLRDYPEYKTISTMLKTAGKAYDALLKRVHQDIDNNDMGADKLIEQIMAKATFIPASQEIFGKAIERMRLGNPPGKATVTVGDEINWESLLLKVPQGQDVHIVSSDIDWSNPLDRNDIHPFLKKEWLTAKKGKAFLYTKISTFFAAHFPEIKVASEIEKMLLIDQLRSSPSFYTTHLVVAKLSKLQNLTPADADEIVLIANQNSQVSAIIGDNDIQKFYSTLLEKFGESMDPLAHEALKVIVYP